MILFLNNRVLQIIPFFTGGVALAGRVLKPGGIPVVPDVALENGPPDYGVSTLHDPQVDLVTKKSRSVFVKDATIENSSMEVCVVKDAPFWYVMVQVNNGQVVQLGVEHMNASFTEEEKRVFLSVLKQGGCAK